MIGYVVLHSAAIQTHSDNLFTFRFISFKPVSYFTIFTARVSPATTSPTRQLSSTSALASDMDTDMEEGDNTSSSSSSSWDTDTVDRKPSAIGDSSRLAVGRRRRRRRTVCRQSGIDSVTSLSSADCHACLDLQLSAHKPEVMLHFTSRDVSCKI